MQDPAKPAPAKKDDKRKKEEELTPEDQLLQDQINHLVAQLVDPLLAPVPRAAALKDLKDLVRNSTTTMTSLPKPFKFIKAHYPAIEQSYLQSADPQLKPLFADFLSVLAMTFGKREERRSLRYFLEGTKSELKQWGHQYLLHLASNVGKEYVARSESGGDTRELLALVDEMTPYFVDNNAEHDAIDLLMMVDRLELIKGYVTAHNFSKINQYLTASSLYSADQEELEVTLHTLYELSLAQGQYMNALRMALRLDDYSLMCQAFASCTDTLVRKQMAFVLARQRVYIPDLEEELNVLISNSRLSHFYLTLAKDLEVQEPKHPSQIYKKHLGESKAVLDSARENLYSSYVNAFVNAGLKDDHLLLHKKVKSKEDAEWIHKTKGDGQIAAVASIGLLDMWDPAQGSEDISPYLGMQGPALAGALLGTGIYNAGITSEDDVARALLVDALDGSDQSVKAPAILGLGIAYAGQARDDIKEALVPIIVSTGIQMAQSAFAALALGMVFVGKCNDEAAGAIIETLIQRTEKDMNDPLAKFFAVGIGLIYLGQQDQCSNTLEALKVVQGPMQLYFETTLIGLAYAGSGNVLKAQEMMHICKEGTKYAETGVLAMALIAGGEQIGNEMCHRIINHLLQYGSVESKKAVCMALATLNLSNPKVQVTDLLTKLCHDPDVQVSNRAVISLGLVAAGTNNSRVAQILRKFGEYFKDDSLFAVRIAQGLLYLGKGMLSIQPYHSEKFLMNKVAMAGLATFIHSLFELGTTFLGKHHYLLFSLSLAMYPKMLFVLDQHLDNMPLQVRVGQAVDTVGQAGKPKRITGFQTHQSPVILGWNERAELQTEEYLPVQETQLQNLIIIKKNPDYKPEEEKPLRKKTGY